MQTIPNLKDIWHGFLLYLWIFIGNEGVLEVAKKSRCDGVFFGSYKIGITLLNSFEVIKEI